MNYFLADAQSDVLLQHSYSPWLVFLSFAVATFGSALALFVASNASQTSHQKSKTILMAAGGIAFGSAVWCMHFIGMLALALCTSVSYHADITLLSAVPAMLAGWVVLHWISKHKLTIGGLLLGGCITGAGIGLMHYSGMFAMQMSAALRFDPYDFVLSIVAAVVLATLALWSRNGLLYQIKLSPSYANSLSAVIMGLAITTMHYMGMSAARFVGPAQTSLPTPPTDWLLLTIMVTMGTVSVLGFVASGVLFTRLKDSLYVAKVHGFEMETIIENSTEGIVTTQSDGTIKTINKSFAQIFGCAKPDATGHHLSDYLPDWNKLLKAQSNQITYETLAKRHDGGEFPIRITLTRFHSGLLAFYVGFLTDLSDAKRVQDQLLHEANHDFLTGLHNRRFFEDQLELELSRSRRSKQPFALIMMDIDHFKSINDTYGHLVGDRVLAFLASELKKQARAGDVVSRYGGEEFMVLLPNTHTHEASRFAQRLRSKIEQLELINNTQHIHFTVSVGVTCTPNGSNISSFEIIEQADTAMYRAKNMGRNRVEIFQPESTRIY